MSAAIPAACCFGWEVHSSAQIHTRLDLSHDRISLTTYLCALLQVGIQSQKLAEALSCIKGGVGFVNGNKAPTAALRAKSAYSSNSMLGPSREGLVTDYM